jgi:hypothetical protein
MILAAFLISSAVVLVALALMAGAQEAAREKARETLLAEVSGFLEGAAAKDSEHASGTYQGMHIELELGHHDIFYSAVLPPAIIRYSELVARFASDDLKRRMAELAITVEPAANEKSAKLKDRVHGTVPREPGLSENLVTIANRLPIIAEVRALRSHAPGELLERLASAHSAYDVDQILVQLAEHFPNAPETEEAVEIAAEREHGHPDRVRARAQKWLSRATA